MANRNTQGFGLIAQGTVGSTMASQGQGKYLIDAGMAVDLFQGTAVRSAAGYIVTAQAAITNTCIGVLNGIFYNDASTKKPTFANFYNQPITPANSEDVTCFVVDNPLQLFSAVMDTACGVVRQPANCRKCLCVSAILQCLYRSNCHGDYDHHHLCQRHCACNIIFTNKMVVRCCAAKG